MKETKRVNDLPFKKVDDNTVVIVTRTADKIIESYINLCPKSISEASELHNNNHYNGGKIQSPTSSEKKL